MSTSLLTTDELAKATGLLPRTIRYYRSVGILEPVKQPGTGNRLYYSFTEVQRILELRSASWNLPEKRGAVIYHLGGEERASELVFEALVEDAVVLQLADGTIVIKRPLMAQLYKSEEA